MDDNTTTPQLLAEVSDYWDKTYQGNLYNLVDGFNSRFNLVNDTAEKIEEWREIAIAQGTSLDLIGEDEQAHRSTQDDDAYRFWIWLKYLIARAQGTYPSFMKIGANTFGTDQGFNIWNTDIHHVGVQIPYDLVPDVPTAMLITNNIQNLLALGIWIGSVHYSAQSSGELHTGTVIHDTEREVNSGKTIWWTGWSDTNEGTLHAGAVSTSRESQTLTANWADNWAETSNIDAHSAIFTIDYDRVEFDQKAVWWQDWKDKQDVNINTGAITSSDDLIKLKGSEN